MAKIHYEEVIKYIKENYKDFQFLMCYQGKNNNLPTEISLEDLNFFLASLSITDFFEVDKNEYPEWEGYGAAPYRINAYLFIHTNLKDNIKNLGNFITIDDYPESAKNEPILSNELGAVSNFLVFIEELPSIEFEPVLEHTKPYTSYIVFKRTDKKDLLCFSLRSTR